MGIYKLKPACKDYLWGGHRLVEEYGIEYDGDVCAEAWVLSGHRDGLSVVADGADKGKTLTQLIDEKGKEILGENSSRFEDFPIMIKLIDAKKPLSIQVHPDDAYAKKHENQYGKTEMWYILDADEGAFLYQGFDHEITKEEFERRIRDNTLTDVLNKVYVKKGDMIFISPGTLHAIGAGIVIAEIQQSSNVTYRIYDYGRVGADGRQRELHIAQSLDVTKLEKPKEYVSVDGHLASCEYFCVDRIKTDISKDYSAEAGKDSFVHVLVVDGKGEISTADEHISIKKGDSVFITANTGRYDIKGELEAVLSTVPAQ